jgi:uncharacterized SAM-binding protein YcdF (DUF218 family)
MFFWLKKTIGYWLMPVPLCLVLLVLGLCLSCSHRRARLGRWLMGLGTLLLVLFTNKFVSQWLVRPLETRYPAVPELVTGAPLPPALASCRFVVVLGAGNGNSPGVSALNELSTSARARITEAVRILRALPDARLIVSGPAEGTHVSHATVLERAAVSLGIDPARIERVEHAHDTEDEAHAVRDRVGSAPCVLVTSAWHMPRAAALFRHTGVNVLPCPTDYTSHSDGEFHWRDFLFDMESMERSTFAVRERIGYTWIWLRRKT